MKWFNILLLIVSLKTTHSIFEPSFKIVENLDDYYDDNTNVSSIYEDIESYIENWRISNDIPGIVAAISVKGNTEWTQSFGLSDLENDVKTSRDSVWRLASISKPITTALFAKLFENGKIDLNASVNEYLSTDIFPVKQWNGKNVTITVKQLLSHTAGLRVTKYPEDFQHIHDFTNVTQTLMPFKNDPLVSEPGSGFNYSNYGFQVLGAIIESVLNETFETAINRMLAHELLMTSTFAERHEVIIARRTRYYMKNKNIGISNQTVVNAYIYDDIGSAELMLPCCGLVSTVDDLLRFGNFMLSSYNGADYGQSGLLKSSTVQKLWSPVTPAFYNETFYGEGWVITNPSKKSECITSCPLKSNKHFVIHTGGVSGTSTFLGIAPDQQLVIVLLTNLGGVDWTRAPIGYIANKYA